MAVIDPYAATNALASGFNFAQGAAQSGARRRAGNALTGGKRDVAMAELNEAGLMDEAGAIETAAARRQAMEADAQDQERKERLTFIRQGVEGLLRVPVSERQSVYQSTFRPVLAQMGLDEDALSQIDNGSFEDGPLRGLLTAVGGELDNVQTYNTREGIYERDPYSGEYTLGQGLAPEAPNVPAGYRLTQDGNLEFIPGGPADPRVVETRSAAGRAPPRPRSGGGGGGGGSRSGGSGTGGGSSSLPTGFTPVRRR